MRRYLWKVCGKLEYKKTRERHTGDWESTDTKIILNKRMITAEASVVAKDTENG